MAAPAAAKAPTVPAVCIIFVASRLNASMIFPDKNTMADAKATAPAASTNIPAAVFAISLPLEINSLRSIPATLGAST